MSSVGDWKHIKKAECPDIAELNEKITSAESSCEVCQYDQDLRICLTCGKVFCCESHNAHNTEHFQKTKHPFVKPFRCDYNWLWCYKCNAFLDEA